MTHRRKTLLAAVVLALGLGAGGFAWYRHHCQTTAVDRQVDALLDEVWPHNMIEYVQERKRPGWFEAWLIRHGLKKEKEYRGTRGIEVAEDLKKLGPAAVPQLTRRLRDRNRNVRITAAHALGKLRDRRAVKPLIRILNDEDEVWPVRYAAIVALGRLGDDRAFAPLMAELHDIEVREAAIDALAHLGDPRTVDALIAALKGERGLGREGPAEALSVLGDARAIGPLEELLSDENELVRRAAKHAIDQIRQRAATEPAAETQAHGG